MTNVNPDVMHLKVDLNFDGVFVHYPFTYTDDKYFLFTDHDFVGMDFGECVTFLERFMKDPCEELYYYVPNVPLHSGLQLVKDDVDYVTFYRNGVT